MWTETQQAEFLEILRSCWPGDVTDRYASIYCDALRAFQPNTVLSVLSELAEELKSRPRVRVVADLCAEREGSSRTASSARRCDYCGSRPLPALIKVLSKEDALRHGLEPWQDCIDHPAVENAVVLRVDAAIGKVKEVLLWCHHCQRATNPIETDDGQRWLRHPALGVPAWEQAMAGWFMMHPGHTNRYLAVRDMKPLEHRPVSLDDHVRDYGHAYDEDTLSWLRKILGSKSA